MTVRQFNMNSGLCSPVGYAEWQGRSCYIGIILIGAPPLVATPFARVGGEKDGYATATPAETQCLVLQRKHGATQFIPFDLVPHGTHSLYVCEVLVPIIMQVKVASIIMTFLSQLNTEE